jgi:hypothetical protein
MYGMVWQGYLIAGSGAFKGKDLGQVTPFPFPTPPAEKGGWYVVTAACTPDRLVYQQANAYYTYKQGDAAVTFVAEVDLRGGRLVATTSQGYLLGVRGQDYFVLKPSDKELKLRPFPVESSPRPVLFLAYDGKRCLWGGPLFGQTLFSIDPKTKETANTGCVCDGGGEVYGVTFLNGKVYAASYAGGDITEYDPDQPWDQWGLKNPRPLVQLSKNGYIRPVAGIMPGPGDKLYSGWMTKYGAYGGAIAITDPATGATELIENPFGEQAVYGLVIGDHYAYVGTSLEANGLPTKTGESPKFGILDLTTRQKVFEYAFDGAKGVRLFGRDAKTGLVAACVDDKVLLFDAEKREWLKLKTETPLLTYSGAFAGKAFIYANENNVVRLDLKTLDTKVIATAPAAVNNVVLGHHGAVYVSSGSRVYRLRGG